MKDFNITIVNYKMKEDLERCLSSLFKEMASSKLTISVNIVDNSKNIDNIQKLIQEKFPSVKYFDAGGNLGFGKSQNIGFESERAKYYISLNPDIRFLGQDNVLEKIFEFMENNSKAGIVGPKEIDSQGKVQLSCFRFSAAIDPIARRLELDKKFNYFKKRISYFLMKDFNHNQTVPVDWVQGSFLVARGEMAEKIGFFDDRFFMYFEDNDWCRRAWQAGWKVFYLHNAVVEHGHRRDSAGGGSALANILQNQIARIHVHSWIKYFFKWKFKKKHFGY